MKKEDSNLFVSALTELKETAVAQGNVISKEQLEEILGDMNLNDEQMDLVYQYLKDAKIGVDEPVDAEEYVVGEDRKYLDMYLEELAELPPCSQSKKEALLLSAMAGETSVRDELIQAFLPQVADIAKIYAGQGVLLEDLIGEGNVALAVVMDMLGSQENAGEAEEMVVQMVMKAMESLVYEVQENRDSTSEIAEKANMVLEKANALAEELLRKVTRDEVCQETGLSREELDEILRITGWKIEVIDQ